MAGLNRARRHNQAAASVFDLSCQPVCSLWSSNPLIPLACVDVSSQDHDGGGR